VDLLPGSFLAVHSNEVRGGRPGYLARALWAAGGPSRRPGGASFRRPSEIGRIEMMHDAQVYLSGYVATEPTYSKTARGDSKVRLRVAYTTRYQNRETGEWSDGQTTFVTVHCWRVLADNVAKCLRKGEPVLVMGRMSIRKFTDPATGAPRSVTDVDAISVGHDLSRGVANFSRTRPSAGETAAERAEAQSAGDVPGDGAGPDGHAGALAGEAGSPGAGRMAAVPDGGAVVDEQAVADFARELGSLSTDADAGGAGTAAEPDAGAGAEAGAGAGAAR
jgi:single-strand DNA-binding protein